RWHCPTPPAASLTRSWRRLVADWPARKLHFIGIGGAGMSGLALVCAELGATVTGSDRGDSSYMERLRAAGLDPEVGHDAANLPEGVEVVVSTAIGADNPELALARERGIEPIHRGALLAELCAEKRLIAVAGTHGKTTTTAMLVWALRGLGADPAFFVGGEVPGLGPAGEAANAGWGGGEWVIAEADESDGSFLRLKPEIAIVTNVEMDHHNRWGSLAELRDAFDEFTAGAQAVVRPEDSELEIELAVPGHHNLLNARAAVGAAVAAGFEARAVAAALADFPGVKRRLELKGRRGETRIYDDYAHHPTEVRAALSALREQEPGRLIAVFQPHLYSRTKAFGEEFGAALALADEVAVLDVYPAREEPVGALAGVSGLRVAQVAAERMGGRRVLWLPDADAVPAAMARILDHNQAVGIEDQVLVTIGAGDVFKLGEALVAAGDSEQVSR
ncbi:MAG TPA: Mur ligase domain-containing protein, partial [Solirubrobacterales bacterium]|nr:Mur ligase domain-containing protein [Solirubrobacterales bacterium]